jgi:DNA-binding NtrC family response regulator
MSQPLVVIADDNPSFTAGLEYRLKELGYRVRCAPNRHDLIEQLTREVPALLLLDLFFGEDDGVEVLAEVVRAYPSLAVVLLTAHGSIQTAVQAMKLGAYDYLEKPPDLDRLQTLLHHAVEKVNLQQRIAQLERLVGSGDGLAPILGDSNTIQHVKRLIHSVARTDATVLILGESGVGKELVARALHDCSGRSGEFIPLNMASLPSELVESTLFGHEKGAFTGADRVRKGCCEIADKGTLFLDEIGEMPLPLQAKLLRFLQERTFQRVGSGATLTVDVRIVAATNRDPRAQVGTGGLRQDLYYRLNEVPIHVPPLRARREDIPILATRFLQRANARYGKEVRCFTPEAMEVLKQEDWPGNIRQLENLINRLVILSDSPIITAAHLSDEIEFPAAPSSPLPCENAGPLAVNAKSVPLDELERTAIMDALRKSNGQVGAAAVLLGIGQATLYRKVKSYGLAAKDFRL